MSTVQTPDAEPILFSPNQKNYVISDTPAELLTILSEQIKPNYINVYSPIIVDLNEPQVEMLYALQAEYGLKASESMAIVIAHTMGSDARFKQFMKTPSSWRSNVEVIGGYDEVDPQTAEVSVLPITFKDFIFNNDADKKRYLKLIDAIQQSDDYEIEDQKRFLGVENTFLMQHAQIADTISINTGERVLFRPIGRGANDLKVGLEFFQTAYNTFWENIETGVKGIALSNMKNIVLAYMVGVLESREALAQRAYEQQEHDRINTIIHIGSVDVQTQSQILEAADYTLTGGGQEFSLVSHLVDGLLSLANEQDLNNLRSAMDQGIHQTKKVVDGFIEIADLERETAKYFLFQALRSMVAKKWGRTNYDEKIWVETANIVDELTNQSPTEIFMSKFRPGENLLMQIRTKLTKIVESIGSN